MSADFSAKGALAHLRGDGGFDGFAADWASRAVMRRFAPPTLLCTSDGFVLATIGDVGPILRVDQSPDSGFLVDLVRPEMAQPIRNLLSARLGDHAREVVERNRETLVLSTDVILGEDGRVQRLIYVETQSEPVSSAEVTELERCHAAVRKLADYALVSEDLQAFLDMVAACVFERLGADMSGVLLLDPTGQKLVLTAGIGWSNGYVGVANVDNLASNQIGYALRQPDILTVRVPDPAAPYTVCARYVNAGVVRAACLRLGSKEHPTGVLEVCWAWDRPLDRADEVFLGAVADVTAQAIGRHHMLERIGQALGSEQALINGLPIQIAVLGADLKLERVNAAFEIFGINEWDIGTVALEDIFPDETLDALADFRNTPERHHAILEARVSLPAQGDRTFLINLSRGPGASGPIYLSAMDIDERKRAEERVQVVSAELNHRVKNILSLVLAISFLSGEGVESVEDFQAAFEERLQSLARTHDLLAEENWSGATVDAILRAELEAYGKGQEQAVVLDGPDVALSNEDAQSFALAVHELVTNSVKYGALSSRNGKLTLEWRLHEARVTLDWTETLPGFVPPTSTGEGFGQTLVRATIVTQMQGTYSATTGPEGMQFHLSFPRSEDRG